LISVSVSRVEYSWWVSAVVSATQCTLLQLTWAKQRQGPVGGWLVCTWDV